MIVLLVRHGQSLGGLNGVYQGVTMDYDLTEQGFGDSERVYEICNNNKAIPDIILTSPLKRALHTANIIYEKMGKQVPLDVIEDLKEVNLGILEGNTKSYIKQRYKENLDLLKKTDYDFSVVGGESKEEVKKRAKRVIEHVMSLKYEIVMLVTHGAFLRELLELLLEKSSREISVSNGSVIAINIDKERGYKYEWGA